MSRFAVADRLRTSVARRFLVALKRATHRMPVRLETPVKGRVLVVAPHMDDEAIACGGTLLLHQALGSTLRIVFVSDSSGAVADPALAERVRAERRAEMHRATARLGLGLEQVVELGFPDGALVRQEAAIGERLAAELRTFAPDALYCPFPVDSHADHQATAIAVVHGIRRAGWSGPVYAYEVWAALWPNVAVDIGAVVEAKAALIRLYASQMADRDYAAGILGLNRYRGLVHKVDYAEAFHRCTPAEFESLTGCLDRLG